MAVNNSTATLTNEMQTYYDKVFLERLQAETAYDFLTSKRSIPKNSGKVVYLTRQTAFTPTTGALTEGRMKVCAFYKSLLNTLGNLRCLTNMGCMLYC